MAKKHEKTKRNNILLPICIAFLCGFLAGTAFTVFKLGTSDIQPIQTDALKQSTLDQQTQQAISTLVESIKNNPDDVKAWTQLGHLYFDSNKPEKAIEAYNRSIQLNGGDANIFTDLGIMYRRAGKPQKAIEAFDKAIELNSSHQYSRLNKGIVLLYDLKNGDAAISEWEQLLKLNPDVKIGNGELLIHALPKIKEQLKKQQEK